MVEHSVVIVPALTAQLSKPYYIGTLSFYNSLENNLFNETAAVSEMMSFASVSLSRSVPVISLQIHNRGNLIIPIFYELFCIGCRFIGEVTFLSSLSVNMIIYLQRSK